MHYLLTNPQYQAPTTGDVVLDRLMMLLTDSSIRDVILSPALRREV
jgi:lysyl-tRNA synthetase class II